MDEKLHIVGMFTLELKRPDGSVSVLQKQNMIVNGGFDLIADALSKSTGRPGILSYLGIGTGTTAVAAEQTSLTAELLRKTVTYTHDTNTKVFVISATFNEGEGTGTITEAGLFNAVSSGTMFNRVVFTATPKGANDIISVKFTFNMS